jgi:hypothetical protein
LCCWNQIVGLPKKGNEGTKKAIFDYEMDILHLLEGGEEWENNERRKEREEGGGEGKEKLGEREKEGKEGKEERKKKKKKYIWIKKSTGLGISEFFLRYIAFICTRDNALQYKRICVVIGPR